MATKKKVTKKVVQKYPRELSETEFEVRDLQWAVGVQCPCGRGLDFFIRLQPHEMVCPVCNRHYEIKLKAYEVK